MLFSLLVLVVSFLVLAGIGIGFEWFVTGTYDLFNTRSLVFSEFEYKLYFWRSLPLVMLLFSFSFFVSVACDRLLTSVIATVTGSLALFAAGFYAMEHTGINPHVFGSALALPFLLAPYYALKNGSPLTTQHKIKALIRGLLLTGIPVGGIFLLGMGFLSHYLSPNLTPSINGVVDSDHTSREIALTCMVHRPPLSFFIKPLAKSLYLVPFTHPMGQIIHSSPIDEVSASATANRVAVSSLYQEPDGLTYRVIELGPPFGTGKLARRFPGTSPLFVPRSHRLSYLVDNRLILRDIYQSRDVWSYQLPAGFAVTERRFSPDGRKLYVLADDGNHHLAVIFEGMNTEMPRVLKEETSALSFYTSVDAVSAREHNIIAKFISNGSEQQKSTAAWWLTDGVLDRRHELEEYIAGSGVWLSRNRLLYLRPQGGAKNKRGIDMVTLDIASGTVTMVRQYPEYSFDFTLPNEDGTSVLVGFKTGSGTRLTQIINVNNCSVTGAINRVRPLYFNGTLLILNTGHSITTFDYKTGTGFRIMDL